MLWLFVFEQNSNQVLLLLSDPISMACIIIDIIIYAWINVWSFSTRQINRSVHYRILVTGGLIFTIADFIFYYMYFYSDYDPNSWVDFAYMLSFSLMAISVCFKDKENPDLIFTKSEKRPCFKFTQKSIFQGKLLELEKNNVAELERKVEERTEEIIRLLNTDFVSGLYSRRYFESKLSETINNIHKNELVSLLFIDQNKSKAVKHLYGKDIFEKLQKIVAESLKQIVERNKGIIASYGDDAFVVMLQGNSADTVAKKVADHVIERCNEVFWVDGHAIRVTMNIGISCYPSDTQDENSLIKNADMAMIQARNIGFNEIQTYSDKIGDLAYNRHRIELKLKKAQFDKEFILYYQPQVYCEGGNLCGFETLNKIKSLGVSIAIDDFGTGYSSLHYMKSIPADRIKIAKELVDNIESDL